ncbi:MAG: c-type cytochrome [Bacteroidetes bacterium]|nr:c-type cytochrome [Bacteroidota bacterium]
MKMRFRSAGVFVWMALGWVADHRQHPDPVVAMLRLPEGFRAERLHSPRMAGQGSWVSLTFDDKGRMLASDQHGFLYRLVLPPIGADTTVEKVRSERIELHLPGDTTRASRFLGHCHGLAYAFQSLYFVVNDKDDKVNTRPSGIYRIRDTDGDDQFDRIDTLMVLQGHGEHGPHSIVPGPDGKSLYAVMGNFTKMPPLASYANLPVWKTDNLLPQVMDPHGHDSHSELHGGWIVRFDPEGKKFTLFSSGFRNPFDLAFNEDGEPFTFDSDMEWDMGTPWYRPTRICHVTSGSEFGWRHGTAKWAPSYPDNLPPLLDIGQGSPTGVLSGRDAQFPERYRKAIFAFDWTFGLLYAVFPEREGAHYKARAEEFLSGTPLPLTDGAIGPDGSLYFLTGGRRIESHLFRVYHVDRERFGPPPPAPPPNAAQLLRRRLEGFHAGSHPEAVATAWPALNHPDRFIRFAARVALEHQPMEAWKGRIPGEHDPMRISQACIAAARMDDRAGRDTLFHALAGIALKDLDQQTRTDYLRAIELCLLRLGEPLPSTRLRLVRTLDALYPSGEGLTDRTLSKILVHLEAPGAVEKTMRLLRTASDQGMEAETVADPADLIHRNPRYGIAIAQVLAQVPPLQKTWHATVLSQAGKGWTPAMQQAYMRWFDSAFRHKGGYSYAGFIEGIRSLALAHVPKEQLSAYRKLSGESVSQNASMGLAAGMRQPRGPGKDWTVKAAMEELKSGIGRRDFDNGKAMFASSLCGSCHIMRGSGGAAGPDLTQTGGRFTYADMLTAILEPSRTISDQYGSTVFYLRKGGSLTGRIIREKEDAYVIAQNPFAIQVTRVLPKKEIIRTRISTISSMLPNLVDRLNAEELKDLLAYLQSGGDPTHEVYKKP